MLFVMQAVTSLHRFVSLQMHLSKTNDVT